MTAPIRLATSAAPRASVIIPVGAPVDDYLFPCLTALARHPAAVPWEAIVVLHGAPPAAVERVRRRLAGVEGAAVVVAPVNLGLAGAANRGRAHARGELLAILHDDTEVGAGWLDELVRVADETPAAGAIGGRVLDIDGRLLQLAGSILWRDGQTTPPWVGKPPVPADAAAAVFARRRWVDYCGTAACLVRASTWDAIGGLEERLYPAYFVDVDLAMAVRRAGQGVLYAPDSVVRHHRAASTDLAFRRFVGARNLRFFTGKWLGELASQEPYEEGSAAIERALARSAAAGERLAASWPQMRRAAGGPERRTAPAPLDEAAQNQRAWRMAADLYRDYARDLELQLGTARAELTAQQGEMGELERRAGILAAIERLRWWRLYQRLLPLLRHLRPRRP